MPSGKDGHGAGDHAAATWTGTSSSVNLMLMGRGPTAYRVVRTTDTAHRRSAPARPCLRAPDRGWAFPTRSRWQAWTRGGACGSRRGLVSCTSWGLKGPRGRSGGCVLVRQAPSLWPGTASKWGVVSSPRAGPDGPAARARVKQITQVIPGPRPHLPLAQGTDQPRDSPLPGGG